MGLGLHVGGPTTPFSIRDGIRIRISSYRSSGGGGVKQPFQIQYCYDWFMTGSVVVDS